MKSATLTALLAASLVEGHYVFSQLVVNDELIGEDYTYIRKNSNVNMPCLATYIIDSPYLRCNMGAEPNADVQTYSANAGDKIGFKLGDDDIIEHPGPGFVYMSKAPESGVAMYDGSGDWFKVYASGLCDPSLPGNDTSWCSYQKDRLEFSIPKEIPAGEYLVRVEHIAIHEAEFNRAQFFMECAQLKVESTGTGTPGPLAKIPGIYKVNDPGITFDKWHDPEANSYVMPGPAVWQA
ncbi:glycoside hydrolase family 61 protein [Jackrogersella minutella]|nr:glycoside hydrolase family 61 protein [Jackrogersella minutella]